MSHHPPRRLTRVGPRLQRQRWYPIRITDPIHLKRRLRILVLAEEPKRLEIFGVACAGEVGAQVPLVAELAAFVAVEEG